MKKIYTLILAILFTTQVFAQKNAKTSGAVDPSPPEKISYQAVIRNAGNVLLANTAVGMKISLLQGSPAGTSVYVETHTPSTNLNGLVSIEIGGGAVVSGTIAGIDWANGPYFIMTETDPTGGTTYTITGTSQLLSVPYALYAKTSGSSTPGPAGPQGLQGSIGPKGDQGSPGPQGVQGQVGSPGSPGSPGMQGAIGPMGSQGAAGNPGVQGTQGLQGIQGVAGTNGTNGQGVPTGGTANQVLTKVDGTDYNTQWTASAASQLEKITEAGNTGWRLLGRNPANYGDIGADAVDLSISNNVGASGATGQESFASGAGTVASGFRATAMGVGTTASGIVSTAIGINSFAGGDYSTAMGQQTTATGEASTAMGQLSTASGLNSVAMGFQSTAEGESSLAMGDGSYASGHASTALGSSNATGDYATAMGYGAQATGRSSVAMGNVVTAKSFAETSVGTFNTDYTPLGITSFNAADRAFVVGIGTGAAKKDGLIVFKDGTLAFNKLTAAPSITTDRLYILNNKVHYNGAEVGANGVPTGGTANQVLAKVDGTNYNTAWVTPSSGGTSELQKITEGGNTGWRMLGRDPANYGDIGSGAIDMSISNVPSLTGGASGSISTAMGYSTVASGQYSTAMGFITTASGQNSTAMGNFTTASGQNSTAMGSNTTASSSSSTAMGNTTTASGYASTAMGWQTIATGDASLAMGFATKAKSYGELVIGQYNDEIASPNTIAWGADNNRVFTVGTGIASARKTAFVIQQNGRVGIGTGTTAITKGLLQIEGYVDYNPNQNIGYLNGGGNVGSFNNTSNTPYSIWASHRIAANEFNAFSDARIKNVIGVSSNTNDLNTLAKIKITDYTMKDKVQYGNKEFKKVIAQELKAVYPQAVNITSNIVPNIYQKATASNGWIALTTDLVKGDKVKIITANSTNELMVEEVANGKFKVATADGEVFVYGKEVNDFHTVDYEALSTLNISATQALLKRIEDLEAKNTNLTSQVKELASLKSDIEAIKAQLNINTVSSVK